MNYRKKAKEGETVSLECKICESDFLAITGTKEYELQICYRCFMNGMAETYLTHNPIDKNDKGKR